MTKKKRPETTEAASVKQKPETIEKLLLTKTAK